VVREFQEETGLQVLVGRFVGSVRRPTPRGVYLINDYACQPQGGQLRPGDDAEEVAWVDAATFAALDQAGALTEGLADTLGEWGCLPWSRPDS
jgi:ADP-ribose pyrophosphatase YjhB (NUDIX family)